MQLAALSFRGGSSRDPMREEVTVVPRLWVIVRDGTLSPLVQEWRDARILPQARDLLRKLAAKPGERVALLSSRVLDDLITRVDVRGVCLGGASSVEWLLPGGKRWAAVALTGSPKALYTNRSAVCC